MQKQKNQTMIRLTDKHHLKFT